MPDVEPVQVARQPEGSLLSIADRLTLRLLETYPGRATRFVELARNVQRTPQVISRALNTLTHDGLIERIAFGKRNVCYQLTQEGLWRALAIVRNRTSHYLLIGPKELILASKARLDRLSPPPVCLATIPADIVDLCGPSPRPALKDASILLLATPIGMDKIDYLERDKSLVCLPSSEFRFQAPGRVTLDQRCLLYLLDRVDVDSDHPAAAELSLDSIADAFGKSRAQISRAMGKLARTGLVQTVRIHVRGAPRRLLAYLLTEAGLERAKPLRRRLEETALTVVDLDGRESVRRLYEVPLLLPRRPRFSDLVMGVEMGRLDIRRFLDRQNLPHHRMLHDTQGVISPTHFRGRRREIAQLDEFLADPRARGLLILGLPGIGKTALASHWVEGLRDSTHVAWRRIRPDTTRQDLLRSIADALRAFGRPALSEYLRRPQEGERDQSLQIIQSSISETRCVFVIDDAHAASVGVARLLEGLLDLGPEVTGMKILLLSREPLSFVAAGSIAHGRVRKVDLGDLPEEEAEAVLEALNVAAGEARRIFERVGGHPLALELAARGGMPLEDVRRTSVAWLAESVVSRLDHADCDALALVAIFDDAVPSGFLGPRADRLLARSLLQEAEDGRVTIHELLRQAVLRDATRQRLADLHRQAAEALITAKGDREGLEAILHFIAAGAFREATSLTLARGEDLIASGLAQGLLPALEELGRIGPESRIQLLVGHAHFALGQWRHATRAYEACESTDVRVSAEALLGRGKAELQRRSRLALPLLDRARDELERIGSLRLLAEAQYWIGCLHEYGGRLVEARQTFERGCAIAFDVGDRRWEGMCRYGVGRISSHENDYRGAIVADNEALELLGREGRLLETAKVRAALGGNLLETGSISEAHACLDRAAREARAMGAAGILASTLYNLGILCMQTGQADQAAVHLKEAVVLFEEQEQYENATQSSAWLAFCVSPFDPDLAEECFRKAKELLARVPEPAVRTFGLRHVMRASRIAERIGDGRDEVRQAITEGRKERPSAAVAKVKAEPMAPA